MTQSIIEVINWGEFTIFELYDSIRRGNRLKVSDRLPGETPLVTAGFDNYGIAAYVDASRVVNQKHSGVSVTIDMFGNVFARTLDFICDDNILVFQNQQSLNANAFVAASLRATVRSRYNYADQFRMKSLNGLQIRLPMTSNGDPDWSLMESFIDRLSVKVRDRADKLIDFSFISSSVDVTNWAEFQLGSLFEISRGVRQRSQDRQPGEIPFYSASESNNGIVDHVSNPAFLTENCIVYTIFGDAFYAPEILTAGDDTTLLHHEKLNEKVGLFIAASLRHNKYKYSFNEKAFSGKISRDTIKLPVTESGQPDWTYMELYITRLQRRVCDHIDSFKLPKQLE